jgi:hypothetical protein
MGVKYEVFGVRGFSAIMSKLKQIRISGLKSLMMIASLPSEYKDVL